MIKQAVILAGGLGTRLRPITNTIPKPMIPFHGKPFLAYLIELLREQGIEEIVLLLGYLPHKISEYFGNGEKWGVKIIYSISPVEDDTGLRISRAKHLIRDRFLLLYCDNYWPLDLASMYKVFLNANVDALVTVYSNKDLYTKNNCIVDQKGFLVAYDKARTIPNLQGVDIGFFILKKHVLNLIPDGNVNFEKEVMPILVKNHNIVAYKTDHRYYSVGSHERLVLTEKFLERKLAIVLDRDGVINQKAPKSEYITKWADWKWVEGAKEAICLLKEKGYQIIIVTNQAGIARGKMTEADLQEIHKKMNQELEAAGGSIDRIYYCPHGWDEKCECRKPMPGMLFQAQRELNLDLSKIYFIGDDERDLIAGEAAGMKTFLVNEEFRLIDFVKSKL